MDDLDLNKDGKESFPESEINIDFRFEDQYACELMHDVTQEKIYFDFAEQSPRQYGFYNKFDLTVFYVKIIKSGYKLCSMSDIYPFVCQKEKIDGTVFHLGMIPRECSDGEYRIIKFYISKNGTLHLGTVLLKDISVNSRFMFRI